MLASRIVPAFLLGALAHAAVVHWLGGKKNQTLDGVIVLDVTTYEFYPNARDCNFRGTPWVLLPNARFRETVSTGGADVEHLERLFRGTWRAKLNGNLSPIGWHKYLKTYWRELSVNYVIDAVEMSCGDSQLTSVRHGQFPAGSLQENGYAPRIDEIPVLSNRLKQFAGGGAIDCGAVGLGQEPDAATGCALKTHADGKPFYVSYTWQGIDSHGAIGFAADADGNIFELEYDSLGWSSEGLNKNLQLSDGNHITIERCSKPVNLRRASTGRVTCFLRDP